MKKRDCTIRAAKTKALISFAVTAKLICVFVFAYAKRWFSHDAAQMSSLSYVHIALVYDETVKLKYKGDQANSLCVQMLLRFISCLP